MDPIDENYVKIYANPPDLDAQIKDHIRDTFNTTGESASKYPEYEFDPNSYQGVQWDNLTEEERNLI